MQQSQQSRRTTCMWPDGTCPTKFNFAVKWVVRATCLHDHATTATVDYGDGMCRESVRIMVQDPFHTAFYSVKPDDGRAPQITSIVVQESCSGEVRWASWALCRHGHYLTSDAQVQDLGSGRKAWCECKSGSAAGSCV